MSVAQILKLHLSFVKVSVAVVVVLSVDVAKKLYSLVYKCLKVFLF